MTTELSNNGPALKIAAEEYSPEEFSREHKFSEWDERILLSLCADGQVLLQGGRGTGKSALMIEASHRMAPANPEAPIFGVYVSLREVSLLSATSPAEYHRLLCGEIEKRVLAAVPADAGFYAEPDIGSLRQALFDLSSAIGKRIILLIDDAAHLGRETSLAPFFDVFRTLSSSRVSCKASIYPGITNFGPRFDVYNDATVENVTRSELSPGFAQQFAEILQARHPRLASAAFAQPVTREGTARLLGQSVLGNMRGFVYACNHLDRNRAGRPIGVQLLGETLIYLAQEYLWPLFDELRPKLGKYSVLTGPADQVMQVFLQRCAPDDEDKSHEGKHRSVVLHRDLIARTPKVLEILEYLSFISRREASRAMKSGGRGSRYAINLCLLLERMPNNRLTTDLLTKWSDDRDEPVELHVRGDQFDDIKIPDLSQQPDGTIEILELGLEKLAVSNAYPYGLTPAKIDTLKEKYRTIGDLTHASDQELDDLPHIGEAWVRRIREVVAQAVWM